MNPLRENCCNSCWLKLIIVALAASYCPTSNILAYQGDLIWIEGEDADQAQVTSHPWYGQVKQDLLSGGQMLSHFDDDVAGQASYRVTIPKEGDYEFWVRANPVQAELEYRLGSGPWERIEIGSGIDRVNIAADGQPDLRFLAWANVGQLSLKPGELELSFRFTSPNHHHGILDCFVLSRAPFQPQGTLKPEDLAERLLQIAQENPGWFPFPDTSDPVDGESELDLRGLNEPVAGSGGFIEARDGQFVHSDNGQSVRFWAVNGPPHELQNMQQLRRLARWLAKYGVNCVRYHRAIFDDDGQPDPDKIRHALDVVEAMRHEGIYTYFSIYFPLWMKPQPGTQWLDGYTGEQHPFAALYFNPDFQARYLQWWEALLKTDSPHTGRPLTEEPAVLGVELINEDSFFFWTFAEQNLPDAQWKLLEADFAQWLEKKYGSLEQALAAWGGNRLARDNPPEGRIGFRPLWNLFNEKTKRDQDTAKFLTVTQRRFYQQHVDYLRQLGFQGLITASNWTTASPEILGPLEKFTYTVGDFIDRHGYFSGLHEGEHAAWSIRPGHSYTDRSSLRFDNQQPGKPRVFEHPVFDPSYNGLPSMISETTFNRPNRYRSEAPLFYAAYGALQGTDAIVHFALDGNRWSVQPNFFMQPWTIMSPAMMGQFPAAALIYRRGDIDVGKRMVRLELDLTRLGNLEGTPLPQGASLDELRMADVPSGQLRSDDGPIDPLVHLVGRAEVHFGRGKQALELEDTTGLIDRSARQVTSSHQQLHLDYGRGHLLIRAPRAQGASGRLEELDWIDLPDIQIRSEQDLVHIVVVSLDDQPLATSSRMMVQVMTEERSSGFKTRDIADGKKEILDIGQDPWLVREIAGEIRFKRSDASRLRVTALNHAGYPQQVVGTSDGWRLLSNVLYYLVE